MNQSFGVVSLFLIAPFLLAACGSDPETSGSGGSAGAGPGSGGGAGSGAGGSGGAVNEFCPTDTLNNAAFPLTYDGTTEGKEDIVTSARLEWTDAPDAALLFVAPETAFYRVSLPLIEPGCGASVREYGILMDGMGTIYDTSFCPPEGSTIAIDGVFVEPAGSDVPLPKGQQMLIWVSCATSSATQEGKYQIVIEKL